MSVSEKFQQLEAHADSLIIGQSRLINRMLIALLCDGLPAGIRKLLRNMYYQIKNQRYREPLKIHFDGQANLFDSDRRQAKAALASTKADLPSLSEIKNLLLAAQK